MQDGLAGLSEALGISEAALRLLFSILLGFPIAFFHRYTLYGRNPTRQHLFFVICGLLIGYWNYGVNVLHSAGALCCTYLIFRLLGSTSTSVAATFVFNMSYLLYGYYTTSTEDYDIKWTMPQCVLTLRLIGLSFNLWDGQKPEGKLSATQKELALKSRPSFLEIAAFSYFPAAFLVGPQFSMRRYIDYVNGRLTDHERKTDQIVLPNCVGPGLFRAFLGFVYIGLYQLGTLYISDQYLLDQEFQEQFILKRFFLVGIWGQVNLYKYISCWLLTEAVCTTFGLTYNGKDEEGRAKWNGCENVKLLTFEMATRFNHYILSFNINTNNWCAEYVYKRLKFLGSKVYSQFMTLLFLALWHGFHSGYYCCFLLEFIIMYAERDICQVLEKNEKLTAFMGRHPLLRGLVWILLKLYTFVFMGYCLVCFVLLSYPRYHRVYSSLYYSGHVIYLSYPLLAPILKPLLLQRPRRKAD